jgi:cytochrome c
MSMSIGGLIPSCQGREGKTGYHMRKIPIIVASVWLVSGVALAHEGRIVDLKKVPPDHQVEGVNYCKGTYRLKLKDGSTSDFKEFNLRFKTDSGPTGPNPGAPVLIPAGMAGDRVFLVFADLDEMKTALKKTC